MVARILPPITDIPWLPNTSTKKASTKKGRVTTYYPAAGSPKTGYAPGMAGTAANNPAYAAPTTTPDTSNNNGTDEVFYGAQTVANPAPAAPDVSVETLRQTPEYMARERALQAALDLFKAKQDTDKARYEENYGKSLSELGYDPTSGNFDLGQLLSSGQRATTSGKAYQALRNDFAARGMLQSGAYQAQQGVLRDQLMKQREAIDMGRTRFLEDQAAALTAQQQQDEQQRLAALEAAKQAVLNSWAG